MPLKRSQNTPLLQILDDQIACFQPASGAEMEIVQQMATCVWHLRQASVFMPQKGFGLVGRSESYYRNRYREALTNLLQLQAGNAPPPTASLQLVYSRASIDGPASNPILPKAA
jgi:hypothetical protein